MKLSQIAENMPAPLPLAINSEVKQRITAGHTIYNFTIGDFDPAIFPIPELLEAEIIKAYQNKCTSYPAPEGIMELRVALSGYIKTYQHLNYTPSEILVTAGGRAIIHAAFTTILDPGDTVIFPVPCWNAHYYTRLCGAKPCAIETKPENNFMLTADEMASYIKEAVLISLCSPQNPSGTVYTQQQLLDICKLVIAENKRRGSHEKKLYVLYDHIYNLIVHGQQQHTDPVSVCAEMKDYTIYMDAISKNFAATGVRVGWGYGPQAVIDKMKTISSHVGAWAPMAEQIAVAVFLRNTQAVDAFLHDFRAKIALRLHKLYKGLWAMQQEGLPVEVMPPAASIYLTLKLQLPVDGFQLLLNEAGVALIPFAAFGAKNCHNWLRLSVGTCKEHDIGQVLHNIRQALIKQTALVQE